MPSPNHHGRSDPLLPHERLQHRLDSRHRPRGYRHAIVVERQLAAQNVSRHDLGREKFLKKVWEWKEVSGGTITQQMRRVGCSADWTREYFTMDDVRAETVTEVFVRLYEQGLITAVNAW